MNPDQDLANLLDAITADLTVTFAVQAWAEDEIARATARHPQQGDVLHHAFVLLAPRWIDEGVISEFVYRSHAGELLERLATGGDTRPPTAAEMCMGCMQV